MATFKQVLAAVSKIITIEPLSSDEIHTAVLEKIPDARRHDITHAIWNQIDHYKAKLNSDMKIVSREKYTN